MLLHLLRHFLGRARSSGDAGEHELPDAPEACNELGISMAAEGRHEEALDAFERALELKPDYPEALVNRGNLLEDLLRPEMALVSYERAISLRPGDARFHINRGNALSALGNYQAALDSYERAAVLDPASAGAFYSRGEAQLELGRVEAAIDSFGRAFSLQPGLENLHGMWLHAKMMVCDWGGMEEQCSRLFECLDRLEPASPPFPLVALPASAALQRKAAETWARKRYPAPYGFRGTGPRRAPGRIRIGYFSADFHLHATSHLMAELFERHDRSRFEITAFSFGPDRRDPMRARLSSTIENFLDVRVMPDSNVAMEARRLGIDIAVDLKGYCKDSRTGIFAHRAAPVQASYLGYPGTMGTPCIDYLIADATIIPEDHRRFYSESIVYLPDSYQPNDTRREISDAHFSREEMGLPSAGFVFCCFNNNFKILPATFERWMRILRMVEGSVLWLLEDNPAAAGSLRREAAARGVDPGRLIFASRMPPPEHLARHRLADLFLDTLPCNAHTTASDALWAGLPVLTCPGETFAGRVAASLLNAIRLPELIARTPEEYESFAIELARSPGRLAELRRKLEINRPTAPLFDIALFTRHLESGFAAMHERCQAKLQPADINVSD